tara:strand:- start:54 stop:395 length:342 start_codon:yes stop_codon:yes gene_type:complete
VPISVKRGQRAKAAAKAKKKNKNAKVVVHKTRKAAERFAKKTGAKVQGVKKKSTAPQKVKGVDVSGLTSRQRTAMASHAKHHTAKHLKGMVSAMKRGKTFSESHKAAMKKVGV